MPELSFLGPDCGCDCDPVPPVTDYFRYRAGAAIVAKGGVPGFRTFARGLLIRQAIQRLSDLAPFSNWTVLVVNDGVNNGCWQTVAGVWVRKAGYESPAGVASTAFFPGDNLTNPPWFAEGDTFATMRFDQGAQFPLGSLSNGGGSYDAMFARDVYAWQASGAAGLGKWEMNREAQINTGSARLSYMQGYGWLKGLGVRMLDGSGRVFEAAIDGADTVRFGEPAFGWQPGTDATVVSDQVRYQPGVGFVPTHFVPGQFMRDISESRGGAQDWVCTAAVDVSGVADRPGLDSGHWKRSFTARGLPWDARPAAYESTGTFTTKVVPRKRFLRVLEHTDAQLLDAGGAVLNSTWGERQWEFAKWDGADRDHWRYAQVGYVACANMLSGEPDLFTRELGAMVEFPAVPNRGSEVELLSTSARDELWSIAFKYTLAGGRQLVVTQTITLSGEITNGEIEEEVIARANGVYAAIVGYGTVQDRRYSDGTILYSPGPDGSPASGGVPPVAARPFMPYQVTFNPRPFAGEFNDSIFFAQHYRVEACKAAQFLHGDETQCLSLAEGEYLLGVRTGTWYKYDCGRTGELVFEREPDPGQITAWDYGDGYTQC